MNFDWTSVHHFAAVDHLRHRAKARGLSKVAACMALALLGLGVIVMLEGGFATDLITRYLLYLAAFTVLSAAFWALFMSQRGRRFFFRHGSAIPSGLEFDEQAVTWLIGKQRLFYRWSRCVP